MSCIGVLIPNHDPAWVWFVVSRVIDQVHGASGLALGGCEHQISMVYLAPAELAELAGELTGGPPATELPRFGAWRAHIMCTALGEESGDHEEVTLEDAVAEVVTGLERLLRGEGDE